MMKAVDGGVVLALALGVITLGACEGPEAGSESRRQSGSEVARWEPLVVFDTIDAAIVSGADTVRITAELANDDDRRSYGLMERPDLDERHGMIFVYPETLRPTGQFWMYRTKVPLDIAFLDNDGEIVSILGMDPCTSPNPDLCRRYSPGVPYRGALEVRRGFFQRHGIEVGDRVLPPPSELPAAP